MPVSPDDFNIQSERTKKNFGDEIAIRCAISRKYYNVGDHTRVVNFIDDIGRSSLSDDIAWLKRKREHADYELGEKFDNTDYQMFAHEFRSVMNKLRSLKRTW